MKIANIVLAGTVLLTVISPAALAQQTYTGMITKIDRTRGTVAIQRDESGTVGSSTGGAAEEFRAQDRSWLDAVHAGDKVNYSITETGGMKTITRLQKQ